MTYSDPNKGTYSGHLTGEGTAGVTAGAGAAGVAAGAGAAGGSVGVAVDERGLPYFLGFLC